MSPDGMISTLLSGVVQRRAVLGDYQSVKQREASEVKGRVFPLV